MNKYWLTGAASACLLSAAGGLRHWTAKNETRAASVDAALIHADQVLADAKVALANAPAHRETSAQRASIQAPALNTQTPHRASNLAAAADEARLLSTTLASLPKPSTHDPDGETARAERRQSALKRLEVAVDNAISSPNLTHVTNETDKGLAQ